MLILWCLIDLSLDSACGHERFILAHVDVEEYVLYCDLDVTVLYN